MPFDPPDLTPPADSARTRTTPTDRRIGARLRFLRRGSGLPQRALAARTGVSFQQIQKYESGSNRLSAALLADLSATFGVPMDWFVGASMHQDPRQPHGALAEILDHLFVASQHQTDSEVDTAVRCLCQVVQAVPLTNETRLDALRRAVLAGTSETNAFLIQLARRMHGDASGGAGAPSHGGPTGIPGGGPGGIAHDAAYDLADHAHTGAGVADAGSVAAGAACHAGAVSAMSDTTQTHDVRPYHTRPYTARPQGRGDQARRGQAPAPGSVLDQAGPASRILLVDDDPDVLTTLSATLIAAGCLVTLARSGDEALAVVNSDVPLDAIVTDYAMVGMDGVELLTLAVQRRPGLPGLVVTGFADAGRLNDLPPGIKVLSKPFRRLEIVERIRAMVVPARTG